MTVFRLACVAAPALALAACAALPPQACTAGEAPAVRDSLYFGTAMPDGTVTPQAWTEFLGSTVTPRFPQGLTAWQASGQWRSSGGAIVREATHVLDLVHPDDDASERAVREIVAAYKTRFRQEAVLRIKTPACASY
jgi:hypothetical protein